ncbi:MAG: hypothetical protein M1819_000121 [Sarea resinae]|nr:MAG: hypothetical protein M1819_000121 [Sarea resinae]
MAANGGAPQVIEETPSIFGQVSFAIVPSGDLGEQTIEELQRTLTENGGLSSSPTNDTDRLPLQEISHIISTTSDFPDYEAACDALIPVVKPEWVTESLARKRVLNPRQYSPDPRLFLSGVHVCCADLPSGDKDAIVGGVLAMGGLYSNHVTRQVTHIVALTETDDKCQLALAKKIRCKIVLPHWFDDCLKLGRRIDESPYLLPNPDLMAKTSRDPVRILENSDIRGASSPYVGRLPFPTPNETPDAQRRSLKVFSNKCIMLSSDLEIGSHLRGTIEDLITGGGGAMTGSVHKADILVCHYREGKDYQIASRGGKDVGNLSWLYHLITHDTWTSPMRRLLHYPIARRGLPGFHDFKISVSNYNGEARTYLENLVKATGGEFTKTMKQDNTHLITAHTVSEKCTAAKEWNINIVNHLWLEESYAKWQLQSLTNPRYTHFPPRTNLGEVVGRTQIDRHAVEHFFFGADSERSGAPTSEKLSEQALAGHVRNPNVSRSSAPGAENPTSSGRSGVANSYQPSPPTAKPQKNHPEVDFQTPAASRFRNTDEKENETPSTNGSRGAKDRAVARLHDLAPDIALYEKEKKRVGGVIFGGRRPSGEDNRKRSMSREQEGSLDGQDGGEARRTKKARPGPTIKLLLSRYLRWVDQPKREDEDRKRLRNLGIIVTEDPSQCTHLAAPQIVRTVKFVCALANAPIVVSTDFVDHCIREDEVPSATDYPINDPDGEERLGINLQAAITRAKSNKHRLLAGQTIYCTAGVNGGFETYKSIVEANGGSCLLYRGRAGSVPRMGVVHDGAAGEQDETDEKDVVYLISDTVPDEVRLWDKFRQVATKNKRVPRIVPTEWILDVAMSQEMQWKDKHKLDEDVVMLDG